MIDDYVTTWLGQSGTFH